MKTSFEPLSQDSKSEICKKFHSVQDFKDLRVLLEDILELVTSNKTNLINLRRQLDNAYKKGFPGNYNIFYIRKKSGASRQIASPVSELKLLQRLIYILLQCLHTAHSNAFGFVKGASILNNAAGHTNKYFVFNIDLNDFFTSISLKQVKLCLQQAPYDLNGKREPIAFQISRICCIETKGNKLFNSGRRLCLPQGAPTSPFLSNLVCERMDNRLEGLAKRYNISYSRYADDMTFSSDYNLFMKDSSFLTELADIIQKSGFSINQNKTRLQRSSERQTVTGLTVNKKVNAPKRYVKSLRMYLYLWKRYGRDRAYAAFLSDSKSEKKANRSYILDKIIEGKLNFLKMVIGEPELYLKLSNKFYDLSGKRKMIITSRENSTRMAQTENQHIPQNASSFLKLFQYGTALKYLTHEYDSSENDFDLERMVQNARQEFNAAYSRWPIPKALYARIVQYAFEQNPLWWRWENGKRIKYHEGWNTPEMKNWAIENPGIHPIRVSSFRNKLITPFKESIQIRAPKLEIVLRQTIIEKFADEYNRWTIHYKNLQSADFFTDVELMLGGIRHILDGIRDRQDVSSELTILFRREDNRGASMKIIEFIHHDSACYKEPQVNALMNGNFVDAKNAFYSLCNWSVNAHFGNECFRINLLKDDVSAPDVELIPCTDIIGFTHTLSFY